MTPVQDSILKVIMQIKINFHHNKRQNVTTNVPTTDHNNTSIKPLEPSSEIETGGRKLLPCPIKDPKIITSPAEVNYHRKVTMKDVTLMQIQKDN